MADASGLYAAHRSKFFAGWTAFERAWASLDSVSLARVAQTLAEKKVSIIPTLVLHDTLSRLDDSAVVQDSMLRYVPKIERERWNVPDMIARAGWQTADYAAFQRSRPKQDLFLRLFAAAGGRSRPEPTRRTSSSSRGTACIVSCSCSCRRTHPP